MNDKQQTTNNKIINKQTTQQQNNKTTKQQNNNQQTVQYDNQKDKVAGDEDTFWNLVWMHHYTSCLTFDGEVFFLALTLLENFNSTTVALFLLGDVLLFYY
jgi:hypothetical protein